METFGFVLFELFVVLMALAGGVVAAIWIFLRTSGTSTLRRSVLAFVVFCSPLISVVYLEVGVVCYGIVLDRFGQDDFFTQWHHHHLPNGYELVVFTKIPEQAYIDHVGQSAEDGVNNVRTLQVAGDIVFVTAYRGKDLGDFGEGKGANRYVVLDTRESKIIEQKDADEFREYAAKAGVVLSGTTPMDAISTVWNLTVLGIIPVLLLLLLPPGLLAFRFRRQIRGLFEGKYARKRQDTHI